MDAKEFAYFREKLNKTQKQLAQLLGTSLKAVHSYEQSWRSIPAHVERQIFFLVSRIAGTYKEKKPCWTLQKCPAERKRKCPAWEFKAGHFCWFINGTICDGEAKKDWKEKMKICRSCKVFKPLLKIRSVI